MLTDLAVTTLKKSRDVVSVDIHFTKPDYWFVGDISVTSRNECTFYVEIIITEGTNTKDEKAMFVKETFQGMKGILGNVSEASYVVIQDVQPSAWGYAGKTQEYRYIANKIANH